MVGLVNLDDLVWPQRVSRSQQYVVDVKNDWRYKKKVDKNELIDL